MPSLPFRSILLPLSPYLHAGPCSHRLKNLEKSDRREMDVSDSRVVDDPSDIKQAKALSCMNECVNESNGADMKMMKQGHKRKSRRKSLAKSASFPSAVQPPEDDEIVTAMQRMFSEESVQSTYSRSISLPTPSELVSALKGSREKQGLPPKKLTVKWAPDVYDPPPTSVLHTVGNRKQQPKSKKYNDKKRRGKKGKKGNNSGGAKDNKQSSKGCESSDRCYKPPPEFHQDKQQTCFNVGSSDPSCGSSLLNNSPTTMHYSVAEAL